MPQHARRPPRHAAHGDHAAHANPETHADRAARIGRPRVIGMAIAVAAGALALCGALAWHAAQSPAAAYAFGTLQRAGAIGVLDGERQLAACASEAPAPIGEASADEAPNNAPNDAHLSRNAELAATESLLDACAPYDPTANDLQALPGSTDPFAFCLNADTPDGMPALDDDTAAQLQAATQPFEDEGWGVGYLLLDLQTGRGLAANLDADAYGASSIKGIHALYVCETQLDAGKVERGTAVSEGPALADMDGPYVGDGIAAYPLETLVEQSITQSDNDSFRIMRATYGAPELGLWMEEIGLSDMSDDDWFPTYSARESAIAWLHMADYLASDAESAAWLGSLLGGTERSFIRDAIGSDAVRVQNKAGWIAGSEPAYYGICDAAVVTAEDRRYLLTLMSNAPDSEDNEQALERLAETVFLSRAALAPAV